MSDKTSTSRKSVLVLDASKSDSRHMFRQDEQTLRPLNSMFQHVDDVNKSLCNKSLTCFQL